MGIPIIALRGNPNTNLYQIEHIKIITMQHPETIIDLPFWVSDESFDIKLL